MWVTKDDNGTPHKYYECDTDRCILMFHKGTRHVDVTGFVFEAPQLPRGGHLVQLAGPWHWASELRIGALGVLGGAVQHPQAPHGEMPAGACITFRARAFLNDEYCSASGGPGTIHTPYSELTPTGEMLKYSFWKWNKWGAGRGNGVDYEVEMPLWDWTPSNKY